MPLAATPKSKLFPLEMKNMSPDWGLDEKEYTFGEKLEAAWHTDNWIGSKMFEEDKINFPNDPDFDVFNHLDDRERGDENFLDEAIDVTNMDDLKRLRRQYSKEQKMRERLTGASGFMASMAVQFLDPINLIPVSGAGYRAYKLGEGMQKGAMQVGAAGAAAATAQEMMLHESQTARTLEESGLNITAASIFSGVMGGFAGMMKAADNIAAQAEIADIMDANAAGRDAGAAATSDLTGDVKIKGKLAESIAKVLPYNPLVRTLASPSQAARRAAVQLAENPIDVDGYTGQALESLVKIRRDGMLARALLKHRSHWKDYRKSGGRLSRREYNEKVSQEVRNPGTIDNPHIKQSAAAFNEEVYAKQLQDMLDTGLVGKDTGDPNTSQQYVNRRWNKHEVAAKLPEFKRIVSNWLREQYDIKLESQAEIIKLDKFITGVDKNMGNLVNQSTRAETRLGKLKSGLAEAKRAKNEKRVKELTKQIDGVTAKMDEVNKKFTKLEDEYITNIKDLESIVADLPSNLVNDVKVAIKARNGKDIKKMYKQLKKAVTKIKQAEYADVDVNAIADEIAGRIMGTPDGMLPYDYKIGKGSSNPAVSGALRGPMKSRVFNIPDRLIEPFLDNDIEDLAALYLRQTSADIEIVRKFEGKLSDPSEAENVLNLRNLEKDITDDYRRMMDEAKDEATRLDLEKRMEKDIRDLAGMRDRIRGTYQMPDPNNMSHRIMTAARNLNFLRLMGGVAVSSFPDMARIVMSEGMVRTFGTLMRPLIRGMKNTKLASADVKYWGIGTDALTGGRLEVISDIERYALGGSKFERGLQSLANSYGNINMMNQWTGMMKTTHAISMQNRIMDGLVKGKYNKNLKRLGISEADAMNIKNQVLKHGSKDGNAWIFNAKDWDNQALAEMWGAALRKESDRVIIVPGQEKPLFMSEELGKTIFQFQSFMMSATQRITMAALQRQDEHLIQGALAMISMGAMTYAFKQQNAGREVSDDPRVWIIEGIDRSGALGIFMEANNQLEKLTSNQFGIRGAMGIAAPASRFASRNLLESTLGPTAGTFSTALQVVNSISDGNEWKESDTQAVRRLAPYQNLAYLRKGLDVIQKEVNESLGVD